MKAFYKILFLLVFIAPLGVMAQNNFFADKNASSFKKSSPQVRPIMPEKFRAIALDVVSLKQLLKQVPVEFTADAVSKPVILSIPMPDGSISRFSIVESPIQEQGLMNKFQDIKTYSGQGIDDRTATIKLDWTAFGFHAQILSPISGSIYIDPYERGNVDNYMSYSKNDLKPKNQFSELGIDLTDGTNISDLGARTTAGFCLGSQLRTYRIAVACTGEYAVAVGATNATQLHSAIVTTVNRVNGVYEKEVAIRLVLVANNNLIEYLSGASDPFNGNDDANVLISESQNVITSTIGTANFDIGHTFSTGGGGLAGLGVVCNASNKARGITGSPQPTGDAYDIDFVAHEVGHQFGGNHTFNALTDNCSGNRTSSTSVEPGSGITIMGYAGICGAVNDLANNSIPYFHTVSQGQIGTFSNNSGGNTCAQTTSTGNIPPVVNAGADYYIPAGTPFMLTGSATDANGDALTYSWEQIDNGPSGANWNSGNSPFFRSFAPTTSPTRYFPRMIDVINGTQTIGELIPTTAQTLNFRLTARDNRNGGGGVCSDEAIIRVVAGADFKVTSQPSATSWTSNGTNTADITWNPANTASAPINATNVSILFSADGGLTYPYTLVQSTPNDGLHTITVPAIATTAGRIMVKGVNNVFFNINGGAINIINSVCNAEGASVSPTSSVSSTVGNAALNLSLNPQYATVISSISGTIALTDANSNLVVSDATNSCFQYSNIFHYDVYPFVVSTTGSYTFARTGAGSVFNFYANSFNPTSLCSNWIRSNYLIGTGTYASIAVNLTAGVSYYLVIGVYGSDATTPATSLPFAYSFAITPPSGGAVYNGTAIFANPGANFTYSYVIIDNATNTIKAISSTADLSNASNYPAGSYTVYGISYLTANAAAINAYIGNNFAALTFSLATQPNTTCGNLSKNAIDVSINTIVPVTLTALKARKLNNTVALEWGTLTETNSSHFVIERSNNGTNFTTTVGRINAAGNTNAAKNYSLNDVTPIKGLGYYRVKQYDLDGRYTYSNVAAINFDKVASLLIVYPNPVKNTLNVEYTAVKGGKIELNIIDAKGAIVQQQTQSVVVGRNVHAMNVSSLANGVYVIKTIDADKNVVFTKFIKD